MLYRTRQLGFPSLSDCDICIRGQEDWLLRNMCICFIRVVVLEKLRQTWNRTVCYDIRNSLLPDIFRPESWHLSWLRWLVCTRNTISPNDTFRHEIDESLSWSHILNINKWKKQDLIIYTWRIISPSDIFRGVQKRRPAVRCPRASKGICIGAEH